MSNFHVPYSFAFDSFGDFAGFFSEDDPRYADLEIKGQVCVADVIDQWLWQFGGVHRCFGDFEIFLKVVVYIVDQYYRNGGGTIAIFTDDANLDGPPKKCRVTSVFGDKPERRAGHMHAIFDRDNFNAAVFNWKHLESNN